MDTQYKIIYDKKFYKDLKLIELRTTHNYYKNLKNNINKMIQDLQFMPRIHKTLISIRDKHGEYRRMVFENILLYIK